MQLIREVYGFVKFDSVAHEKFRVHLNEEVEGVLDYHIEARNSKKQWEGSIGKDGKVVNGIPKEAVFKALKTALESASDSIEDNSKKVLESSSVDFVNVGKENEHLALRILVFETWIGFELPVKNILVKEVDVLRAQVIDAQEEITALKNKQAVQFISVRINANTITIGQTIAWPVVAHNSCDALFAVDETSQNIIVKLPGVYQIHLRIGVTTNSTNVYGTSSLQLNGKTIAGAMFSVANSSQSSTAQITEILVLSANDRLSVASQVSHGTILTAGGNCVFSVLKYA